LKVGENRDSKWVDNWLRPVLISAMMVSLAVPLVRMAEWLLPDWNGSYFLAYCFFSGLEGILSERSLRRRRITGWEYAGSRAAEFLVLVLLLKLLNHVPRGLVMLLADAQTWIADPGHFWTPVDILTTLILFPLWIGAIMVARQATELDADEAPAPAPADKTSAEYYLWLTQPPPIRHRQEALDWLGEMFLWGGIALLLMSALMYLLLPTIQTLVLPTLLYFALGVALLSQARFSVAHAGWQVQGIPVQQGISRRWLRWTLIFLVGIALLALLLPTRYTTGPLLSLLYILGLVAQLVVAIFTFVPYLLALLVSLLFPSAQQPARPMTPPELLPPEASTAAISPPWLDVLLSAIFWTLILAILGYALIRFVRDRLDLFPAGEGVQGDLRSRLLAWLSRLLDWWRNWRFGFQQALSGRWVGREHKSTETGQRSRFFSLRRLPPQALVRFFYLSTVRRAARAGQPRRPEETPYEYLSSLDDRFPELEPDLTGLTDAFIKARYSAQQLGRGDVEAVKPLWQRVKAALRRHRARV